MKKIYILLVLICCLLLLFATTLRPKENKVTIKFSSWGSQSEVALLKPLINKFEKENPDIKVEFVHIPQNYFQKLHLLFASNLAPDVVFINNYYLPKYVDANVLEDLTPYIKRDDFFEKSLKGFTIDNKIYAIPRDVSCLVVYYNKDIFDRYKIPYPSDNMTLREFLKTSQQIKEKSHNKVWGTSFETDVLFWMPFLFSNGGALLDDSGKKVLINEKITIDSINFYANLANKYKVAPKKSDSASMTMAQMFLQQKIAMHITGRWLVPKYREEAKFNWDVALFPKGTKGSIVNIDASGYALSKYSKHKKEAIKFIEFISSNESLKQLTKSGLIVPARKDSAYSKDFLNNNIAPKNAKAFLTAVENGKPTPVNKDYQKFTDKLNIFLEPVFLGKKNACEVLKVPGDEEI